MLGWEVVPRVGFGNFTVSPHGLGIALGYFVGTMLLARRARARGFNEDHAWNAAAISVVGAILGARIAYVVGHLDEFAGPIEWLQIYKGGISLMGGLLGGFLAAYLYARRQKIDFLRLADLGAPGIALGVAIGRIGDLVIGDHLGRETSGWWGWQYEGGELISPPPCIYETANGCIQPGMMVHQTALYDMVWSLVILGVLLFLDRKPLQKGFLVLTWASLYAAGRIATDFTRVDKEWFGLGLTGSQLTAIAVLAVSLFFLYQRRKAAAIPAAAPAVAAPTAAPAAAEVESRQPETVQATAARPAVEAPAKSLRRRAKPAPRPGVEETRPQEVPPEAPQEAATPARASPARERAERESVFKEARERARREREQEEERESARRRQAPEGADRTSTRASRSTTSRERDRARPKDEPKRQESRAEEEEELEEFDWEP